jgi:secreted PhoX family phosphatase
MAAVVKTTTPGYDALSAQTCIKISELLSAPLTAGKFAKLDPVFIDSDGNLQAATDTSDSVKFDGFAAVGSDSDGSHPVTVLGQGIIMEWLEASDNYDPGSLFYVGAANQLESGGRVPVAMSISTKEIICIQAPGVRRGIDSAALPK